MKRTKLLNIILNDLHDGAVIPAFTLAFDIYRNLDYRSQRTIMRYYLDELAGGAFHST